MPDNTVSDVIFSIPEGWFLYNYNQSRLEFLSNETKLVLQTWEIPIDQWQALPSQRRYCESIVNEAIQQQVNLQQSKQKYQLIFKISAFATVVLSAIDLYFYFNHDLNWGVLNCSIIAFGIASYSYHRSKEI